MGMPKCIAVGQFTKSIITKLRYTPIGIQAVGIPLPFRASVFCIRINPQVCCNSNSLSIFLTVGCVCMLLSSYSWNESLVSPKWQQKSNIPSASSRGVSELSSNGKGTSKVGGVYLCRFILLCTCELGI